MGPSACGFPLQFSNNLGEAIAKDISYSCSLGLCLTPTSLRGRCQGSFPAAQLPPIAPDTSCGREPSDSTWLPPPAECDGS